MLDQGVLFYIFLIYLFTNFLGKEYNKMINMDKPTWSSENSFVTKGSSKENLVANRINSWKEKFEFRKCLKFKMDSSYCSAE